MDLFEMIKLRKKVEDACNLCEAIEKNGLYERTDTHFSARLRVDLARLCMYLSISDEKITESELFFVKRVIGYEFDLTQFVMQIAIDGINTPAFKTQVPLSIEALKIAEELMVFLGYKEGAGQTDAVIDLFYEIGSAFIGVDGDIDDNELRDLNLYMQMIYDFAGTENKKGLSRAFSNDQEKNNDSSFLKLTNNDVREYKVKELPYNFVLFHHIPISKALGLKNSFNGNNDDNALLTYCYIDRMAGLSYRAICWAKLYDNGRVEYHKPEAIESVLIIREGSLECPAEIIDENADGMRLFKEEAESIKENYGYLKDKVTIHPDIPFDEYRHPAYPDDILVVFYTQDKKVEKMWVREQKRNGKTILGYLMDEPYNRLVGLHKGDMVEVAPNHTREGVEFPMAVLDWMR